MKIDLHCHSEASFDCVVAVPEVLARARMRGIGVQALTDHNEIWGAQKLQRLADDAREKDPLTPQIIVGEEVSTLEGELIGLYLMEVVPRNLSPEETVARIKGQGGLVLLPHGFDPLKKKRLRPEALARIADDIDIVETFNARISRPRWNRAGENWADARGLPKSGGSDAHIASDIGDAWTDVSEGPVNTPGSLLRALSQGQVRGSWTPPLLAFGQKVWDSGFEITRRYLKEHF